MARKNYNTAEVAFKKNFKALNLFMGLGEFDIKGNVRTSVQAHLQVISSKV